MFPVQLYIYDLSFGLARTLSAALLGTRVEGIWHTSIVVYGKEYFYGSHGISSCPPAGTSLGEPLQKLQLGATDISETTFEQYLEKLSQTRFKGGDYHLLDHNCNTFSNHIAEYLVDGQIPRYILELPAQIESTPLGSALRPAIQTFSAGLDNIPRFGLKNRVRDLNNHSFDELSETIRPIMFDEPLLQHVAEHHLKLLWPCDSQRSELPLVMDLFRLATCPDREAVIGPEHFSLLALDRQQTEDQCRVVLDLFRLIVWRNPNIFLTMLTDPQRHVHRLTQLKLPTEKSENALDLYAAQAKMLSNGIGHGRNWLFAPDDQIALPLSELVHLGLLLLDHSDHRLDPSKPNPIFPEHVHIGLALCHNLSLCQSLSADDALELGSYLLHLAVVQQKSYKQPVEAIYLLRAVYFLVIRFPLVADLARAVDLTACLTVVLNEATTTNDTTNGYDGMLLKQDTEDCTSVDYLIATRLLDYLSSTS